MLAPLLCQSLARAKTSKPPITHNPGTVPIPHNHS
jgi:hypothetical protein